MSTMSRATGSVEQNKARFKIDTETISQQRKNYAILIKHLEVDLITCLIILQRFTQMHKKKSETM